MNAHDKDGQIVRQCGLATLNAAHITAGAGEFTDFYLYITAQQDKTCEVSEHNRDTIDATGYGYDFAG